MFDLLFREPGFRPEREYCGRDQVAAVIVSGSKLNVSALGIMVVLRSDKSEVHDYPPKKKPRPRWRGEPGLSQLGKDEKTDRPIIGA